MVLLAVASTWCLLVDHAEHSDPSPTKSLVSFFEIIVPYIGQSIQLFIN